jgi:hypothetical protein
MPVVKMFPFLNIHDSHQLQYFSAHTPKKKKASSWFFNVRRFALLSLIAVANAQRHHQV